MTRSWIVSSANAEIISTLGIAVDHALNNREWVIVVCPDSSAVLSTYQQCGGGLLPAGTARGGRTDLLPNGGKVSVVAADTPLFVPEGQPFTVMFLGWGDDIIADAKQMGRWRHDATRILDRIKTREKLSA